MIKKTKTLKNCPGCKSSNIIFFNRKIIKQLVITSQLEEKIAYGVCGCQDCGVIFLNPRMNDKFLSYYYKNQSRIPKKQLTNSSPFEKLINSQIDFVSKYLNPLSDKLNVLEIGSAEGFYLFLLSKRYPKSKLNAVEISDVYIEQLKEIIPSCTIYPDFFENIDFLDQKFNFIIIRHVLEHISQFNTFLNKLSEITSVGSYVYIEVPDAEIYFDTITNYFHHEHMNYFTKETLSHYLNINSFSPLVIETKLDNPKGSGFSYPVIRCLAKKEKKLNNTNLNTIPKNYASSIYGNFNNNFILFINRMKNRILDELSYVNANSKISIFGAGPHTVDLLDLIDNGNICFFCIFDNNPNKNGTSMSGIPVYLPTINILKTVDVILLSSFDYEEEMNNQLENLGFKGKIIKIYDR